MLRFSLILVLATTTVALAAAEIGKPLSPVLPYAKETPTKNISFITLRHLIQRGNWTDVAHHVKSKAKSHEISLKDLQMLSLSFPNTPFFSAVAATKAILSLHEKTGLSLSTTFPIALFAETALQKEITKGKTFWNSNRFGRELQYDMEGNHLFIHLGTHGVKPVGIGRMKVVTKTILYDISHPEVMARAVSESKCKREMFAMRYLKKLPHVLEAQALMRHKDPETGKHLATIVTKIIRPGSLQNIIESKSLHLTLKEKVGIACDILEGISGMHKKGFAHCDLGARNYFIEIQGKKPGHRKIEAYVADFGRTIPFKHAKDAPVQGNSLYMPPEAIFREKMKGRQYCQSDLFAVGCVFWRMYFGKKPLWSGLEKFKNESISRKNLYRAKVDCINATRNSIKKKFNHASAKGHKPSLNETFLRVILKMTAPDPLNRGQAYALHKKLCKSLGRPILQDDKKQNGTKQ